MGVAAVARPRTAGHKNDAVWYLCAHTAREQTYYAKTARNKNGRLFHSVEHFEVG